MRSQNDMVPSSCNATAMLVPRHAECVAALQRTSLRGSKVRGTSVARLSSTHLPAPTDVAAR